MAKRLYLGVEGFLIHRLDKAGGSNRMFSMTTYGLDFLSWAVEEFDCYWMTKLDQYGGDHRIRRALALSLGYRKLPIEFDPLFEYVRPTYWENSMIEGIDCDSDFVWITDDVDEGSRNVLEKRGLLDRLILKTALDSPEVIGAAQATLMR